MTRISKIWSNSRHLEIRTKSNNRLLIHLTIPDLYSLEQIITASDLHPHQPPPPLLIIPSPERSGTPPFRSRTDCTTISKDSTSPAKYSFSGIDLFVVCQPIMSFSVSRPNLYMYCMKTWKAGRIGRDLRQHYMLAFIRVPLSFRQVRLSSDPHYRTTFSMSFVVVG